MVRKEVFMEQYMDEIIDLLREQTQCQQKMVRLLYALNDYVGDEDSEDFDDSSPEQDNRSREELLAALEKVSEEKDGWKSEIGKLEKQQGALMEEYMRLRSHFLSVSNELQAVTKERDDLRTRLQQFNLRLPQIDVDE